MFGPTEPTILALAVPIPVSRALVVLAMALLGSAAVACRESKPRRSEGESAAAPTRGLTADSLLAGIQARGRPTLVNVWATFCAACREELPMFQKLQRELSVRGIDVVEVSVDEAESESRVVEMLHQAGFRPPYYRVQSPLGDFKQALHPRWPGNVPVTFLFDGSGRRRYFWGGPIFENELMPIVNGFLAGQDIDGEADFTVSEAPSSP